MDLKKLSQMHLIAGIGAVVAFISYFLPWVSAGAYGFMMSFSGFQTMGLFQTLGLLGAIAVIVVVVFKALPSNPVPQIEPYETYIILGGGALGLLGWLISLFGGILSAPGFGYFIALIAFAAVTVAGYFLLTGKKSF